MPTGSKKSTALDLSAILEGLLEADIKFISVGGLAAVVQGAPVTTPQWMLTLSITDLPKIYPG